MEVLCMVRGNESYLIDDSLINALAQDGKWVGASNAAKRVFDHVVRWAIGDGVSSGIYGFEARLVSSTDFKNIDALSGRASLAEAFDAQVVLLEVEFEQSGKKKKAIEVIFDDNGQYLHAALF